MGYAKELIDSRMLVTDSETTVTDVCKKMADENVRNIFVIKGGKPVGLVRDIDIIFKVIAKDLNPKEVKVEQIMTAPAPMIDHKAGLVEVAKLMAEKGVRRVLLMEGDKMIGSITAAEVLRVLSFIPAREVREAIQKIYPSKM